MGLARSIGRCALSKQAQACEEIAREGNLGRRLGGQMARLSTQLRRRLKQKWPLGHSLRAWLEAEEARCQCKHDPHWLKTEINEAIYGITGLSDGARRRRSSYRPERRPQRARESATCWVREIQATEDGGPIMNERTGALCSRSLANACSPPPPRTSRKSLSPWPHGPCRHEQT